MELKSWRKERIPLNKVKLKFGLIPCILTKKGFLKVDWLVTNIKELIWKGSHWYLSSREQRKTKSLNWYPVRSLIKRLNLTLDLYS